MPLSPQVENELKALYQALRDRVLLPDDAYYVASVNQRPETDAVGELSREIAWQESGGVCLITGQRGTGKSTELRRLQSVLDADGASVFYVDMSEYLLTTKEIEISDFLMAVAGAFSEKIAERYDATPGNRGYWERLVHFLGSEVVLDGVTTNLSPVSIKASLKDDPHFKKRLQEASRGHVARLVQEAHDFVSEAVGFVRDRERDADRKVVLIVDSIERIRGVGNEAMDVYDSVRDLFVGHAQHLLLPSLHVVYSIPPYLSVLAAGAGGLLGGAVPRRLVSVHTVKHHSRESDPEGLDVMREVIAKRHPGWRELLEEAALDRLAVSSGGDLREFFRLIRLCLPSIRDDSELPLTVDDVRATENAARSEILPIPRQHLDWLARIVASHTSCLEKDSDVPTLAHFLDNRLVLVYRNGEDWYDVHPLLRDIVAEHAASRT